ncbi:MAG: hypothetical protein JWN79_1920 [Gemmatimonadetes bacterium]|jgi:hypothetical protein|nr:hypothetical protein [Gemmatimonadota bacterium]
MRPSPPDGVYAVPERLLRVALGAALSLSLAACSEQVTGSAGCPQLCANEGALLRDTVLTGTIALDTTFVGFPRLGSAPNITLVGQGDTADVRVVARFDTLANTYRAAGAATDSAVTQVDSAALIFVIDTTIGRPTGPIRLEAFDVDTTAADTLPRTLLPLFRANRALGNRTYEVAELKDTVRLPLSNSVVLTKIKGGQRLRIGLRLVNVGATTSSARLRISSSLLPIVRYRVSPDTLVHADTARMYSRTPADEPGIASGLGLYPIVASGRLPAPPNTILAVAGLNGARSYLQFSIPAIVLDSVQVLRATLQLTQRPSRAFGTVNDTIHLVANPVIASASVTDLFTASQFFTPPSMFSIDTLRLVPRDSGVRRLEIKDLVRTWRSLGTTNASRALVLRSPQEGELAGEINFYSSDAVPASLRPTLRLTYVPRRGFGLP